MQPSQRNNSALLLRSMPNSEVQGSFLQDLEGTNRDEGQCNDYITSKEAGRRLYTPWVADAVAGLYTNQKAATRNNCEDAEVTDVAGYDKPQIKSFADKVFSFLPSTKDYDSYRSIFIHEEISLDIACDLDDEALMEIGISKKIHRSKILKTIQKIVSSHPRGGIRPSSPPIPIGHKPIKRRSRTPPGLYSSPPRARNVTPGKPIQRGEPEYIPGQSRMFFTNMQLIKPNTINWEVTLERHFSQFGQNVKITYIHQKKLAFVELVIDPDHTKKFPSVRNPFVHHTICGHRLMLKVANHPPYGPKTKELVVKVGSRVAGLWNGKYLPATVCEVHGDLVYVLFDGYEGFKEAIQRKAIKHLNQVDGDSETNKIHDWVCPNCQNNCFGSKPTCNMCGEVSPSIKKIRALKPGVSVTCSFGNERHRAVVDSIIGKLVFVRRDGAQITEPTTVWDIEMVGPEEGRSIITPGAIAAPAKKIPDRGITEGKVRHWISTHPNMCLAKLCSSVDIPYRSFGFQTATAFLKSMQDVRISPHPQNIVTLVGKDSDDTDDLRQRIEARVLTWAKMNPGGHVNMLCSRIGKIPYDVWGFAKPMNFLKSIDGIVISPHPTHIGVHVVNLTHNKRVLPIATRQELRLQLVSFVKKLLDDKNNKFSEYVPYNILIKGYDSHAKRFGYNRLLDFIQQDVPELEIQKNPDARVYLKRDLALRRQLIPGAARARPLTKSFSEALSSPPTMKQTPGAPGTQL